MLPSSVDAKSTVAMEEPAPLAADIAAQNKGPTVLAVSYPLTVLTSLFVAGRLFSRRRKLGRWEVDDYIILVSLVRVPPTALP